ncbi:MAG: Golgi transport complex subunit 6 [Cirrosporium novae-zelandiae]|nr:MAG: Golgi transport complex subunit 6 [Cirrosporium novae-zelandiae]
MDVINANLDGTSDSKSNLLPNRLTAVLSTSYADGDIRQALETLDARGLQNTPETRRRLRLNVQKELIDCNGDIINDFGHVSEQLKRVGIIISTLSQTCEDMRRCIATAHQETAPVLEETTELMTQKKEVEQKQLLLEAFNQHFLLSDDELVNLTSSAEPVDDAFFAALKRVKIVHRDCETLLGSENQRLGVEIMEQSAKNLNNAYQKLFRWIQREFKSLNLEDPHISRSIRRALPVLAERPSLFQSCIDAFAETRQNVLAEAFYSALTEDGPANTQQPSTKPIEFFAHDPLRYVGDMLAWTHSAAVSEREALEGLFIGEGDEISKGIQEGMESEPWSRDPEEEIVVFDGPKALTDLINRDLAGVVRILRQRVEQVIMSQEEALITYKILNLISFYRITFSKLLGRSQELGRTLSTLEESAFKQFRTAMQDQIVSIDFSQPSTDVSVPGFLEEALDQLTALMKTYDASLIPQETRQEEFKPILAEALDPFLTGCEQLAKSFKEPANDIFLLNCLLATQTTLAPYKAFIPTHHLTKLTTSIQTHTSNLRSHQHSFLLRASKLHPLLSALMTLVDPTSPTHSAPSGKPALQIRSLPAFQPECLAETSQDLDDFLPSALMDAMELLKGLRNPKLAKEITDYAAGAFCEDFEFVEESLVNADEAEAEMGVGVGAENGAEGGRDTTKGETREGEEGSPPPPPSLRSMLPRTSAEIRVLLS